MRRVSSNVVIAGNASREAIRAVDRGESGAERWRRRLKIVEVDARLKRAARAYARQVRDSATLLGIPSM